MPTMRIHRHGPVCVVLNGTVAHEVQIGRLVVQWMHYMGEVRYTGPTKCGRLHWWLADTKRSRKRRQ